MDRSLLAAAAAAGVDVPLDAHMFDGPGRYHAVASADGAGFDDSSFLELPSVDDLEVAAAAAAAALEALAPPIQSSESDSSEDDSSDSDDDDSSSSGDSSDGSGGSDAEPTAGRGLIYAPPDPSAGPPLLRVRILPSPAADHVVMQLHVLSNASENAATATVRDAAMREAESDSSPFTSSDESDVGMAAVAVDDAEGEEVLDRDAMHAMIERAYAAVDEEEDEEGGAGARNALQDLGLPDSAPSLEGLAVLPDDALEPAGLVLSVLDGMLVVQGQANSRPLAEGSLVVTEAREPLGVIEEVFGPVAQPLYAFRYTGQGSLPDSVVRGAALFVVPRLSRHITADELFGNAHGATSMPVGGDGPDPNSDDELYFSDDEAEAHYLRQAKAKRKGPPGQGEAGHPAGMHVRPAPGQHGEGAAARPSRKPRPGATGPGAQFQAHATAGHLSAVLGLGDSSAVASTSGRGGQPGGRGGMAGRAFGRGSGRGTGAPQAPQQPPPQAAGWMRPSYAPGHGPPPRGAGGPPAPAPGQHVAPAPLQYAPYGGPAYPPLQHAAHPPQIYYGASAGHPGPSPHDPAFAPYTAGPYGGALVPGYPGLHAPGYLLPPPGAAGGAFFAPPGAHPPPHPYGPPPTGPGGPYGSGPMPPHNTYYAR